MDEERFDVAVLSSMIDYMAEIPRFVVDPAVIDLITTDQAMMSIGDMSTCKVLRLPYQACVVEFDVGKATYNILLRETEVSSGGIAWLCSAIAYRADGNHEGFAVASPCMFEITMNQTIEDLVDTQEVAPAQATLQYSIYAEQFVTAETSSVAGILEVAYPLAFHRCLVAYLAAMLLPQTVGLKQEEEITKKSFNLARLAKGRSPIPDYTKITLGSYYAADGSRKALAEGHGVEVHLRRAHKRRIAFGPKRSERAWRFFPAQVVGYLPDGRKPSLPEMLATRATKPYLLK
jgi:hypothetical protein